MVDLCSICQKGSEAVYGWFSNTSICAVCWSKYAHARKRGLKTCSFCKEDSVEEASLVRGFGVMICKKCLATLYEQILSFEHDSLAKCSFCKTNSGGISRGNRICSSCLIECKLLLDSVGSGSQYKIGEELTCRICRNSRGGYEVYIEPNNISAMLYSDVPYHSGARVLARFVGVLDGQIRLKPKVTISSIRARLNNR